MQKKDEAELKQMLARFPVGSTWTFSAVKLSGEKAAYIFTGCWIAIDLRKIRAMAMLQSTGFPTARSR